jgi:antitoxin component of MazEF toxin-antitoxin module
MSDRSTVEGQRILGFLRKIGSGSSGVLIPATILKRKDWKVGDSLMIEELPRQDAIVIRRIKQK